MKLIRITFVFTCFLLSACSSSNNGKTLSETISYPDRAWNANVNGSVTAIFDIDGKGRARNIKIADSHPRMMFDKQVKDALKAWQFEKGKPEKGKVLVIQFKKN